MPDRFIAHPAHRPLESVVLQEPHIDPREIVGFIRHDIFFILSGLEQKSNVVVEMRGLPLSLGNSMNIEIKDLRSHSLEIFQTRFLETFLHSDG